MIRDVDLESEIQLLVRNDITTYIVRPRVSRRVFRAI